MSDGTRPALFTSATNLANTTAVFLGMGVITRIPLAVMLYQRIGLLAPHLQGEQVNMDVLGSVDHVVGIFSVISSVLVYPTAVFFVIWMYRTYRNLPALGAPARRFPLYLAVLSWAAPIGNLFVPYIIMQDIWKTGDPQGALTDPTYFKQVRGTPLIAFWWVLWQGGNVLAVVVQRMGKTDTVEQFMRTDRWTAISQALFIVSGLLAIAVVLGATGRQEARRERLYWFFGPSGSQVEQQG